MENKYDVKNADIAWCPGCGNHSILKILKETVSELNLPPEKLVMVSGIGQAAKTPHYIRANVFNGLHGRALPAATAIKATNPDMTVIAESGDGDMYGEGGNHFIHTIRRNPNIANFVHNNMVYGLTKGQASPSSQLGFVTPIQTEGVFEEPMNPLAVAIALNASFVARAFCGDQLQTKEIMKKAILHNGYALVDIFQPCVIFNKINTYKWFKDNTYYLDESYNPNNRIEAFKKVVETDKMPLGVIYLNSDKKTFEENLSVYQTNQMPLALREIDRAEKLQNLINSYK